MDPHRFVGYFRTFGRYTLIWPPDRRISRREFIINELIWFAIILFNILSIASVMIKVIQEKLDSVAISNLLSNVCIMADCCLHIILVRIQWPRFQMLIHEVTTFLKRAKLHEKIVCRKYMKRYLGYQFILALTFLAAITNFLCRPLILETRFPIDAWYPFSTEPIFNRVIVYIFQYVMVLETLSLISGDGMIIVLLWYTTARLKLLGTQLHKIRTAEQLRECVKIHDELITFVRETEDAISLIILKSLGAVSVIIVSAGLLLSQHRDIAILSQFFLIVWVAIVRLYGCAWAADDLTEMAGTLSWAIYHSPALGRPLDLSNSIAIVIARTHTPLTIRLWGVHLDLSLRFFTTVQFDNYKYSLKVLSFFMTLRTIIDRAK